jgi:hypothetical protein
MALEGCEVDVPTKTLVVITSQCPTSASLATTARFWTPLSVAAAGEGVVDADNEAVRDCFGAHDRLERSLPCVRLLRRVGEAVVRSKRARAASRAE